jgi:hypothetical protein
MNTSQAIDETRAGGVRQRAGNVQPPVGRGLLTQRQKFYWRNASAGVVAISLLLGGLAASAPAEERQYQGDQRGGGEDERGLVDPKVELELTPSSAQLAACMPDAELKVRVDLDTEEIGFDHFSIRARHLPPNRTFTVFLLEQAGPPFGAAEYIGDFSTNARGNGSNTFGLIVQEAFSSTLVSGQRVRVDLNRVGVWFADPKDDDFCLGQMSPVTPFDGDNEAGVQAFNSANADPLPAP